MSDQNYATEIESVETMATVDGPQKGVKPAKKAKKTVKSVKAEQAQDAEEKRFKLDLYPADDSITDAPLSELVPLDSTPIQGASYAMREINQNHLSNIQAAVNANESLPDLTVVRSNMGMIVVDGYHRWMAYEQYLKEAVAETDTDRNILEKARTEFRVGIHTVTAASEHDLLKLSFEANLRHGLPASGGSRARYAMFMFEDAKQAGVPISVREAARKAVVDHSVVLKAMKREAARQQKMLDELVGPEDKQDALDFENTEDREKQSKAASQSETVMKNIVKACKYFGGLDMSEGEMQLYMTGYANEVNKDEVESLIWVLTGLASKALPAQDPEQQVLIK